MYASEQIPVFLFYNAMFLGFLEYCQQGFIGFTPGRGDDQGDLQGLQSMDSRVFYGLHQAWGTTRETFRFTEYGQQGFLGFTPGMGKYTRKTLGFMKVSWNRVLQGLHQAWGITRETLRVYRVWSVGFFKVYTRQGARPGRPGRPLGTQLSADHKGI